MLKAVSFCMDYHWSKLNRPVECPDKHREKCGECSEKALCLRYRSEAHATDYSLSAFTAYFFYCPLYLAGPTTTYNAWISQVQVPQQTYGPKRLFIYILRFLSVLLLLECFIHCVYMPAIAKNPRNRHLWAGFSAYDMVIGSFWVLKWI